MIRFRSIRQRMLLGQTLVLLAVIIGFGGALFWQVRQATLDEVDADLFGAAQVLAAQSQQTGAARELRISEIYRHRFGPGPRDVPYFGIWDADRKLLAASDDLPERVEPESKISRLSGPRPYLVRDRAPFHEIVVPGPKGSQVVVGRPLHREMNYLRSVLGWSIAAGLFVLAGGLAAAWLLARAILRPIERMTETAERISAANLTERVNVPQSGSEVGRLALVLNQMFGRLQASFERQTRFTADASHELRTPVSVVLSHTELALAKERTPAEYREALEACLRAARRMKSLVEGLLTLARSDAGQLEVRREVVDLQPLVESSIALLKPLAEARRIELACQLQSVQVRGDADHLSQVLANLLGNAIAYNRDDGRVDISLTSDAGQAVLSVADTGIGISEADLPKIFERFYQVDKARSSARTGSGLGLAICQEIVRNHRGTIDAKCTPGQGTTFTIRLPLASPPSPSSAPAA